MPNLVEPIDHELIDPDALKVVRRLVRYHHEAYLVGGCVRDLLLGRSPKDFDVATSATPNEIRALFRNARVIGRRFRLAHIFFGPKIIETSTFRKNPRGDEDEDAGSAPEVDDERAAFGDGPDGADGMDSFAERQEPAAAPGALDESLLIRRDNVFGTAEDDALRRDFTMNALFYDPVARRVIDFAEGRADLERRLIRTIGDPDIRFQEDPVRILRAVKFAARLGLTIEPRTFASLTRHRESIRLCAKARVLEEIYRLLREGAAAPAMRLLIETGVQEVLLPELNAVVDDPERRELLFARLAALDALGPELRLTNAVLLAATYFGTLLDEEAIFGDRQNPSASLDEAMRSALHEWTPSRRDRDRSRQILMAQRRLAPETGRSGRRRRRPSTLASQDYFLEAVALYKLRCHTGEADPSTLERWEALADRAAPSADRAHEPAERSGPGRGRRRGGRSRTRRRHPREGGA